MAEHRAASGPTIERAGRGRRRFFLAAAVLLVLAGVLVAVLAPSHRPPGSSPAARAQAQPAAAHRPGSFARSAVGVASEYLGLSRATIRREMASGHPLAAIADSTPGRSAAGLIDLIVRERSALLRRRLAPERLHTRLHRLRTAVTASVHRLPQSAHASARLLSLAAAYLRVPRARLGAQVESGRTLAEVANGTPGHSEAGLVAALLAVERTRLRRAVAAGTIDSATAQAALAALPRRLGAAVRR